VFISCNRITGILQNAQVPVNGFPPRVELSGQFLDRPGLLLPQHFQKHQDANNLPFAPFSPGIW
jgi:hypothetical protein